MGPINLVTVFLGALAFFAVGVVWYGPLFGKLWRELNGFNTGVIGLQGRPRQNPGWLIMLLAFLFELLISLTLGHLFARTFPPDFVKLMMAVGFGLTIMTPALGVAYLFQRRPGALFFIDAGYFIVGMAAMGGVYIAMA